MHTDIATILTDHGIICPRQHPHLADRIDRAVKSGQLAPILRGAYGLPDWAPTIEARVAAISALYPNATFIRETAAHLTWWPELQLDAVQVAGPRVRRAGGFRFERRTVGPDLRDWDGDKFVTTPAQTVLDLTESMGGAAIDEALRRQVITLDDLWTALRLGKDRAGNGERERLLRESRDLPWSELERTAHIALRKAHIAGWVTNHRVTVKDRDYFLDAAFPRLMLALEFDGWEFHRSLESFIADRQRDVQLSLAGWTVLRFTDSTMATMPGCVAAMIKQLEAR
ncbi:DUF559 domain-containing protein [Tessaracoccus sp. G1721]